MRFLKIIKPFFNRRNSFLLAIIFFLSFIIFIFLEEEIKQYRNSLFSTDSNNEESSLDSSLESSSSDEVEKLFIDLDGNGEKEYIVLTPLDRTGAVYLKAMIAYDKSDKDIAVLPSDMPIKIPITDSFKAYKLNKNDPREFFRLDFIAGPHQSETLFFGLSDDLLLPVCHEEEINGPYDCLFYSGNVGYLPIKDLDGDGYLELIEAVDEYPSDGELNTKEENAIDEAFKEQEVDEFVEGAEIIARREKGGRGRTVVWSIYSFNGEEFIEQTNNDYEKFYSLIGDFITNKMRKSGLSKGSLEYIQSTKDFWSHKAN